ncbi:MAG: hydroxyphenylacetyl-CoA thioesterase PaaI [Burkholderiales bacterium]|nr:MAG: hydroxyphenylacetyl-CoA thioesterase PaaI [Burkholderiales bacterium]
MSESAYSKMTPAALAEAAGRIMWEDDRTSRALGIELLEMAPGRARWRMRVRRDMTNGHGICHGGYIFLLADSTFAYACNSHNQRAVAASAAIDFLAPAHEGDELTAEGVEQYRAGRSGVYDMRVTDQTGKLIALFRGKSATIKGHFVEDTAPERGAGSGNQGDGR